MLFELHCHSNHSDGLPSVKEIAEFANNRLEGIALTDHNTFKGYKELKKINKDLLIIPSAELSTDNGHLLIYGIEEIKFKLNGDIFDIIDRVKSAGGAAVIAHPLRPLKQHVKNTDVFRKVDAIEVLNGNSLPQNNTRAMEIAKKYKKPRTAGSDAHRLKDIGRFACEINAFSIDDFIKAIKRNRVKIPDDNTSLYSIISKIVERRARKYKRKIFN